MINLKMLFYLIIVIIINKILCRFGNIKEYIRLMDGVTLLHTLCIDRMIDIETCRANDKMAN